MWVYFKGTENVNCKGSFQEKVRYTLFGRETLMIAAYRRQFRGQEAAFISRETGGHAIDVKLT